MPKNKIDKVNQILTRDLTKYFNDYGVQMTKKFSLEEFRKWWFNNTEDAVLYLFNLEDTNVMRDIADGNYSTFDPNNSNLFNDSYPFMDEEDDEDDE